MVSGTGHFNASLSLREHHPETHPQLLCGPLESRKSLPLASSGGCTRNRESPRRPTPPDAPRGTGPSDPTLTRRARAPLQGASPSPPGNLTFSATSGTPPKLSSHNRICGKERTSRTAGRAAAPPGGPRETPHARSAHARARALGRVVPDADGRWEGKVGTEEGHARLRPQVFSPP